MTTPNPSNDIIATANRRAFLKVGVAAAAATIAAPSIATASRTNSEVIIGEGAHQYRVEHHWPKLPSQYNWQTTHNVAVDQANNLYVIHEGKRELKDHPSIFVFDEAGKFVRAFGSDYQGGGHGLEVRKEGNEEFLYVTGYQQVKKFAKLSLKGDVVWEKRAPKEAGAYNAEEYENPTGQWGRDRFMPTNFAFLDDGGFLVADGYGAFLIHRYDKDGKWLSCFGGAGKGEGTFETAHGIWIDRRNANHPMIVVTDRAHNTLQRFTMEGKYIDTLTGFGLPANIDIRGDLMLVPELNARVTLLGPKNEVVAHLGSDVERIVANGDIRNHEDQWIDGKFVRPHDACFDNHGNIFVAEWVSTGRISKLTKV